MNYLYDKNIMNENLKNLNNYMFYNINIEEVNEQKDNNTKENKYQKNNSNNECIPKFLKHVNYNKLKSKYNECENYKNNEDTLFFIFYKLFYNKTDEDLIFINLFTEEKSKKIDIINFINTNKLVIKNKLIKKSHILENLTSDKKIDLLTFYGLCFIYNIDLIVVKNSKLYSFITNKSNEDFKKINLFNVLFLEYNNLNSLSNSFKISFKQFNNEIFNIIEKYFYVKNIEKPLNSISSYKMDDLNIICNKLNINLLDSDTGKKKNKQKLYNDVYKFLYN